MLDSQPPDNKTEALRLQLSAKLDAGHPPIVTGGEPSWPGGTMYDQLLAEAIHADRIAELDRIRFALHAKKIAAGAARTGSADNTPFWQRSLAAVRRTPARSVD